MVDAFVRIDCCLAGNDHVTAVNGNGEPAWSQPYDLDTGNDGVHVFGYYLHSGVKADNNGNMVVWQYYHSQDNQRLGVQVNILDGGTGQRRSVIYTDDLLTNKSFNGAFVGLGAGRLYLTASVCDSGTCGGAPSLFAINVPDLSLDFPRAAALGLTPQQPVAKKYAWLGDSFASGEGAPGFDTGTDVGPTEDNFNMCHRSTRSYAHLLDQDPDLSLQLLGSYACSGATTAEIINTYQYDNQLPQTLLLNSSVDTVTVSIGGNDVGFASFAISCVDPQTTCDSTPYQTIMSKINNDLPGALDAAYAAIKAKVGTSTKIVVVGYPQLIPDPNTLTTWPYCGYLSPTEKTDARSVVTQINQVTAAAVSRAGTQFVFADPTGSNSDFPGHELCNDGSYFNGVTVQDSIVYATAYSFHPTVEGEEAYYRLVKSYLN